MSETIDITALIAELGRLACLVAGDEWEIDSRSDTTVRAKGGYVIAACGGHADNQRDPAELHAELHANAQYIALLQPANIQALLQHIEGQAAQVEGLRSAAQEYLANDGSQGTYDAMKLYDAREVLKSRLAQTPAHSLASHDAELLERIAGEINTLLRKVGTGSFAAKCCCAMAETLMDEAARIRAEAGEQQAKGAE